MSTPSLKAAGCPASGLHPETIREHSRWIGRRRSACRFWLVALLTSLSSASEAVILYSTADPTRNTTAPSGALTNSGWQYQGSWSVFLGTPIAPQFFITAGHVGGTVGDKFRFRGVDYTATATFDDPNSDLQLWRICGTFPDYAQIYSLPTEIGQTVVVFGRGTQRGNEVVTSGPLGGLKGWQWGPADGVQRWGTNTVSTIVNGDTIFPSGGIGGGTIGDLLKCAFDANGGADEAHLSAGDSGGGVFVKQGSVWKLAGINYAVDGPYNTSASGPGFMAAIFDEGGLYEGGEGDWTLTTDLPLNQPGAFYATRISARADWINSVLQSAPNNPAPTLQSADALDGTFEDVSGASVDPVAKTVTAPVSAATQFYRLRACDTFLIKDIKVQGATVVITYQ